MVGAKDMVKNTRVYLAKAGGVRTGGVEVRSNRCVFSGKEMDKGNVRMWGLAGDYGRFTGMDASPVCNEYILKLTKEVMT